MKISIFKKINYLGYFVSYGVKVKIGELTLYKVFWVEDIERMGLFKISDFESFYYEMKSALATCIENSEPEYKISKYMF